MIHAARSAPLGMYGFRVCGLYWIQLHQIVALEPLCARVQAQMTLPKANQSGIG